MAAQQILYFFQLWSINLSTNYDYSCVYCKHTTRGQSGHFSSNFQFPGEIAAFVSRLLYLSNGVQ